LSLKQPAFNKEERVKHLFSIVTKVDGMKEAVKLAREYYKIITLNGKTNLKKYKMEYSEKLKNPKWQRKKIRNTQ
jgi:hypothetical protein